MLSPPSKDTAPTKCQPITTGISPQPETKDIREDEKRDNGAVSNSTTQSGPAHE